MYRWLWVSLVLFPFWMNGQEKKSYVITCLAGGNAVVPPGHEYVFKSATISDGDGYPIVIDKRNFKANYKSGDTISFPYYIPEMELLGGGKAITYTFKCMDYTNEFEHNK